MQAIFKIFRHSLGYFAFNILNYAVPFMLLPILTAYLTPSEYGLLSIYQVLLSFALAFIGMGLSVNISKTFYSTSQEYTARLVGNQFIIVVTVTVALLIVTHAYFSHNVFLFGIPSVWAYTVPIIAMMKVISDFNLNIIRNESKVIQFGVFQISSTVIEMGLSVAFIVLLGLSWVGRAGGIFLAALVMGVVSLIYMTRRGYFLWSPDSTMIKSSLLVSVPLIFHTLSAVIINMSDRFFIEQMIGQDVLGIYNIGYTFGMTTLLIVDAVSKVWTPWLFKQLADDNENQKRFIVQLTYIGFVGYILVAIVLTGASWFLIPILTDEAYHGAFIYVSWVALSYAVRGMYSLVFPYLVHKDKTQFVGVSTVTAAILNLVANYILIQRFGAVGAAQATLISFVVLFLGVWWYARRIYPMPWGLQWMFRKERS